MLINGQPDVADVDQVVVSAPQVVAREPQANNVESYRRIGYRAGS